MSLKELGKGSGGLAGAGFGDPCIEVAEIRGRRKRRRPLPAAFFVSAHSKGVKAGDFVSIHSNEARRGAGRDRCQTEGKGGHGCRAEGCATFKSYGIQILG